MTLDVHRNPAIDINTLNNKAEAIRRIPPTELYVHSMGFSTLETHLKQLISRQFEIAALMDLQDVIQDGESASLRLPITSLLTIVHRIIDNIHSGLLNHYEKVSPFSNAKMSLALKTISDFEKSIFRSDVSLTVIWILESGLPMELGIIYNSRK